MEKGSEVQLSVAGTDEVKVTSAVEKKNKTCCLCGAHCRGEKKKEKKKGGGNLLRMHRCALVVLCACAYPRVSDCNICQHLGE